MSKIVVDINTWKASLKEDDGMNLVQMCDLQKAYDEERAYMRDAFCVEIYVECPRKRIFSKREYRLVDRVFTHSPFDCIYHWILMSRKYGEVVSIKHKKNEFTVVVR